VDFHGVHDWSIRVAQGGRPWEGIVVPTPATAAARGAREEAIRTAYEASPISAVRTWRSPVLLIHGDDDRNVDFSMTVNLVAALRAQGVYLEQLIIPDEIHTFLRHESWLRAYRATAEFLGRKL
jgi:dipeptidyl aminopeptidase/acylaminoacyl peptidase